MKKMRKWIVGLLLVLMACMLVPSVMAEDIVLEDNDLCCIKVKDMRRVEDDFILKVFVENKSDRAASYTAEDGIINGYCTDVFFMTMLPAGKKTNAEIRFHGLASAGVSDEDITKVEFDIHVFDADSMYYLMADPIEKHYVLYPSGEEAAAVTERESLETDKVLIETEDFTVTLLDCRNDPFWGYVADLYINNRTDHDIYVDSDMVSINDYMMDSHWTQKVPAQARKYTFLYWDAGQLAKNDIESVDNIEMTMTVYKESYLNRKDAYIQTVLINP